MSRDSHSTPRGSAAELEALHAQTLHPLRAAYRNRRSNTELLQSVLTAFLHDAVHKVGLQRVVLGLYGGVDSALVAYLAVEALGPGNVTAINMPYRTSNPQSAEDAHQVAR